MTFSLSVKNEILKNVRNLKQCCADAFLYAVCKSIGSLTLTSRGIGYSLSTENRELLQVAARIAKERFGENPQIKSESTHLFSGNVVFTVTLSSKVAEKYRFIYRDEEGLLQLSDDVAESFLVSDCCKRAFVKGLFLSCGSVSVPTISGDLTESKKGQRYHLEMAFSDEKLAAYVQNLLNGCGFSFKMTRRKNYFVLYVKDSAVIADFFVFVNAMAAKLNFENVIIERGLRNTANRQSNCISANIDKAVAASTKQIRAIEILQNSGKLPLLSENLRQMAEIRLDNPEATIEELAALAGVTKSGARHRLDRLVELSKTENDK